MRKWLLLFFLSSPLFASQDISSACINEVSQKIEYKFTANPIDGKLYLWERHVSTVWGTVKWRYCFLYGVSPGTASLNGYTLSNAMTSGTSSVTNPVNGLWFVTNGINFDQAGLDWCTQ